MRPLTNVLNAEHATRIDRRRIDRQDAADLSELAFVMHEFSTIDLTNASSVPKELGPPISVTLVPVPAEQQPPPLANACAMELVDFDLDGRLDVVTVREQLVEVYSRGKAGDAWSLLAAFESPNELQGVVAVDLDRDVASTPASGASGRYLNADLDLVAYGPGGLSVLKNKLDEKTGDRSLLVVRQDAALEQLRNVLAMAVADLDHDGDLDLVVSSTTGVSLWSNLGDMTFAGIGRSRQPPARGLWRDSHRAGRLESRRGCGCIVGESLVEDSWLSGEPPSRAFSLGSVLGRLRRVQQGPGLVSRRRERKPLLECPRGRRTRCHGNANVDIRVRAGAMHQVEHSRGGSGAGNDYLGLRQRWLSRHSGMGPCGLVIYHGGPDNQFRSASGLLEDPPTRVQACAVGDLDCDGDGDLLIAVPERMVWYANEGGNRNHWLDVALRADPYPGQCPDLAVNMYGVGSQLEVKVGPICQRLLVTGSTSHFGLGAHSSADVVRILWTNGIPCNTINAESNQLLSKDQKHTGM